MLGFRKLANINSGGKHSRAWMIAGTAARLQALRTTTSQDFLTRSPDGDVNSRCYWSISTLEKMFSPQSVLLAPTLAQPDYPSSPPRPPPPNSHLGKTSHHPDLSNAHELGSYDQGIGACSLQTITVWGDIISHLRDIRAGKVDLPWLSTSSHAQLTVELYELESKLSHQHLIRNVLFQDRSQEELIRDHEYWTPWITMQIASHAAQAVLNSPFVQLVGLRDTGRVFQPRSFLQQTVDQALFHARWVFRMLQLCENLNYKIYDPLIGQIVAATATIPWLFQFSRDNAVSESSREDLQRCERLLSHLGAYWPQAAWKVRLRNR